MSYFILLLCIFPALEGSPEAQPASVLQRSVSLSSGDVTPTAKTNGELTPLHDRKPSLEELRKQVRIVGNIIHIVVSIIFSRDITFVTSCLFHCTPAPSETGSTLKRKRLLPR